MWHDNSLQQSIIIFKLFTVTKNSLTAEYKAGREGGSMWLCVCVFCMCVYSPGVEHVQPAALMFSGDAQSDLLQEDTTRSKHNDLLRFQLVSPSSSTPFSSHPSVLLFCVIRALIFPFLPLLLLLFTPLILCSTFSFIFIPLTTFSHFLFLHLSSISSPPLPFFLCLSPSCFSVTNHV